MEDFDPKVNRDLQSDASGSGEGGRAKTKPARGTERKKDRKGRTGVKIAAAVIACAVILTVLGGILFLKHQEEERAKAEALLIQQKQDEEARKKQEELEIRYSRIMHSGLFPEGVSIEGNSVSGLNQPEASALLKDFIASHAPSGTAKLVYGDKSFSLDMSEHVRVKDNSADVLNEAMKAGQDEDMLTAIEKTEKLARTGKDYTISFDYDFSGIKNAVREIAEQIDRAPVNSSFTNIDKENHTAETSGSVIGLTVEQDKLYESITEAYREGTLDRPIEIPVIETEPKYNREDFKVIEIEFQTSFKGSNENRKFNIRKGCDIINGFLMIPGEVFSMNEQLGDRSLSGGWKEANAYVSGAHELQAGGGVCQISTTLYNAAVRADLEIVRRTNHSMPVFYVKMGQDATINSVGFIIDFQFRNNTDSDLVIFAWTERNILHTKIIRAAFDTDEYDEIRMSSEKIQDLKPEGEPTVTLDLTMKPGEAITDVPRRDGSIWQSYKDYYKDGKLVRSEKLARSTYKAFAGSYRVGPAITEGDGTIPSGEDSSEPIFVDLG